MRETTHIARPVRVYASQIVELAQEQDGVLRQQVVVARTADDAIHRLTIDMIARHNPKPGDYIVEQEDGYVYVSPREVFERKYRPADEQPVDFDQQSPVVEALRKLATDIEQRGDEPEAAVVVYGTLGEGMVVHSTASSLDSLGVLALGQKILCDVLVPDGGRSM